MLNFYYKFKKNMADVLIWGPLQWNVLIDIATMLDNKNEFKYTNLLQINSINILQENQKILDYLNMKLNLISDNNAQIIYGNYKNSTINLIQDNFYIKNDDNNTNQQLFEVILHHDKQLSYHEDNINEIFKNLLITLKSILYCIWCRVHFRKFIYEHDEFLKNDYFAKPNYWLKLIYEMKSNVNNLNKTTNIEFFSLTLKSTVLTSLGSPEQFWDLIIIYSLNYPNYACKANEFNMSEIKSSVKNILLQENDMMHAYCETQESIKQAFIKFLECSHMLFSLMPVYESLIGFLWPPPLYCLVNSELISNWLIGRQYLWYKKYRSIKILLYKLELNYDIEDYDENLDNATTSKNILLIKNIYKKIII